MSSEEASRLERAFQRTGYVVVKGVLAPSECQVLRERILATFRALEARLPGRVVRCLPPSIAYAIPEAWQWLVNDRVVGALQAILEPRYTLTPELHVQRNLYGSGRVELFRIPLPRRWGWHQDAGSEGFRPIHLDPRYRFVKCGLYLQDNDPDHGGGISLVPGSHRFFLRTGDGSRDWSLRQLTGRIGILLNARRVPVEPGDAVFFHSFVWHSSTLSAKQRKALTEEERRVRAAFRTPLEQTKLTLYTNACRTAFADDYLRHSLGRAREEAAEVTASAQGGELFFCDTLAFHAMEGLPSEFQDALRRHGVRTGTLDGASLEEAKRLRASILASGKLQNVWPSAERAELSAPAATA